MPPDPSPHRPPPDGAVLRIDDRLDAYAPFFDHRWAARIAGLAAATPLDTAVAALGLQWQAAAEACAQPWHAARQLQAQAAGWLDDQAPLARRLTNRLADRLFDAMAGAISHSKRRKLEEAIQRLGAQLHAESPAIPDLDLEAVWNRLLAAPGSPWPLAVWSTQRGAYTALYHAYEDFVRQCVAAARRTAEPKGYRLRAVHRLAAETFGRPLADAALTDRPVRTARLVRHALAHNGGRPTPLLDRFGHDLPTEGGLLQILPDHTRGLFDLLKRRALRLARQAVELLNRPSS